MRNMKVQIRKIDWTMNPMMCFKRKISKRSLLSIFLLSCAITVVIMLSLLPGGHHPKDDFQNYFLDLAKLQDHGLIVNSTYCAIPHFETWDSSIYPFFKIQEPHEVCGETSYNWSSIQYNELILHTENMKSNGYTFYPGFCCYRIITRKQQSETHYDKNADSRVKISDECLPLEGPRTVIAAEFIVVECASRFKKLARFTVTYRAFHGSAVTGTSTNAKVQEKIAYWEKKAHKLKSEKLENIIPPNILVVGLDSTSRLNFRRFMPKSLSALKRIGAVEMMGFTKVGENTFPNFIPIMNGYSEEDLVSICYSQRYVKQDDCPSVWKRFERANYLTGHVEDSPEYAIFHYLKTGFVKQPVDFYSRPLFIAASEYAGPFKLGTTDLIHCLGPQTNDEAILSYLESILDVGHTNRTPVFATSWSTTISHDSMNGIQLLDQKYADFIGRLLQKGYMENTILFFMGDHGYRFGALRETLIGFYEDKLPNMWIYIPSKIKKQFPLWEVALRMNSRRLSSPYSVYWTFNQILETFSFLPPPEDALDEIYRAAVPRKHRFSFFEEIPESVTCGDIGVPENFCACNPLRPVNLDDKLLLEAAQFATQYINSNVLGNSSCMRLKLSRLTAGAMKINRWGEAEQFIVSFVVIPGEFTIEAEVRYLQDNNSFPGEVRVQRASKINSQHIRCVHDPQKELFCYCPT